MSTVNHKVSAMPPEGETVERKQSLGEWKEIVETCAAFATARGGTVYVGIDPSGKRVGVQIGKGTIEDLANKIKMNTDPPQFPSVAFDGPKRSSVITIEVEESPIKPVWAFGRPIKRVGRTNQRLSRDEAHRLMEISTGRTWDSLPCSGLTLKDVSRSYVRDFLRRAELPRASAETILKNLQLLSDKGVPCNAAALLFAPEPQRFFVEAHTKCARFLGTTAVDFLDEATFEGNVFEQFDNAVKFVRRNTRQAIRITGDPQHERVPEYPEEAVREAIVNALCHRDYTTVGTVQVRIYDDELEVWNPGKLPPGLSIEDLYGKHESHPRNPKLARALHRAGLIEHWGTGTNRMIGACEGREVELEFLLRAGSFVARFKKTAEAAPAVPEEDLNPRQRKALEYVREHGEITNREYQKLTDLKRRQATDDLCAMVEQGFLVQMGAGRATRYALAGRRGARD